MTASPRIAPAGEDDGRLLNIFRTLKRNPELYKAFLALGSYNLQDGRIPVREREIVILRVGWRSQSEYEFGQHTRLGVAAGLADDEIARLAGGPGEWSDDDAALVAMADELCDDDVVSDGTWDRLAARWDDQQLLELLVLAGFYRLVSGLLNSARVALEPTTAGWPDGVEARRAPRA
ncbi:MAG TPA: carboxymuconolactone decarboxylase family protein [Mycobacteriales bacterium]